MTPMLSSIKCNRIGSVFAHNLSRYKSVWILYTITMFLVMPFSFLLSFLSTPHSNTVYIPTEVLFHLLALGMSVALPLILFHYINSRQAVDVFHSLPVSRKNLFWGNYLFGLAVLLIPYLLFGVVTLGLQAIINRELPLEADYPLILTAIICFYSTMVFIMINCGTLFESITYFGIIHVGYPLFVAAVFSFISANTYGYPSNSAILISDILYSFSPVRQLLNFYPNWESYQWWKLPILFAISAIAAFLGAYLYKRRKSESAGQSFAYIPLFYIGSLLVSITVGLGFVLSLGGNQITSYIFGILLGLIVYFILDTIRNRGFRKIAHTAMVGCAAAVLATSFFASSNLTHTFGYEIRVPAPHQIQSVVLYWDVPGSLGTTALDDGVKLTDRPSIEAALAFHQSITTNIDTLKAGFPSDYIYDSENQPTAYNLMDYTPYSFDDGSYPISDYGQCRVKIVYILQNGYKMCREYRNCPFVLTKPLYEIAQSKAYQEEYLKWFETEGSADWEKISLYSSLYQGAVSYTLSPEQSLRLQEVISADLSARSSSFNLMPTESPKGFIELRGNSGRQRRQTYRTITLPIYPSDGNTLSYLEENSFEFLKPSIEETPSAAYIAKENRQALMNYPIKTGRLFFCTGLGSHYGEWIPDKYEEMESANAYTPEFYVPEFHQLTQQGLEELLTMITPVYVTETPHDAVILNGTNYLVYPQYEERVKSLIESGPSADSEPQTAPATADVAIF